MADKKPRIRKMELGVTGLRRSGGIVREEFMPELKGRKKYRAFEEMRHNSPVIGGILHATSAIIRGTALAVEERGQGQQSTKARDLYESSFYDMSSSWEDTQSEIVEEQIVHGSAFHEIVWKQRGGWVEDGTKRSRYDDGLVAQRKIPIRSRNSIVRWLFDDEGGLAGMVQRDPNSFKKGLIEIPIEKALLFRVGANKGNPEGRALLRPCYEPRYFEREVQRIEAIGIERELNGIPLAKVPPEIMHPSASTDEQALYDDIKDIVTNLRADEMAGVVFPRSFDEDGNEEFDLSLLSTGGRRAIDTDKVIARYQTRQGIALLASFMFLGMTSVGAKAVADPQIDLFKESLQSIANGNMEVFNTHLLPRMMRLNGFGLRGAEWPEAIAGKVNAPRMDELADFVNKLVGVEVIRPDDALEDRVREAAHLPEREGADVRKTRKRYGWTPGFDWDSVYVDKATGKAVVPLLGGIVTDPTRALAGDCGSVIPLAQIGKTSGNEISVRVSGDIPEQAMRYVVEKSLSALRMVAPEDYPLPDTFPDGTRQANYEESYGDTLGLFQSQSSAVVAAVGAVSVSGAIGAAESVIRAQFGQWQQHMAEQILSRSRDCAVATFGRMGIDSPDMDAWSAAMEVAAQEAANELASHITNTTLRNIKAEIQIGTAQGADPAGLAKRIDTYYRFESGPQRSDLIAQDIAGTACSLGSRIAARMSGATSRTWVATMDGRTRYAHALANGQTVGIDEMYTVGGEQMDGPHDASASLENRIRCRCGEVFS